jgi:hypothetical protein
VDLLVCDEANLSPEAVSFELSPGQAVRYANALDSLFHTTGAGTLRITSVGGDLIASARTATSEGGASHSVCIDGMDAATAAGAGQDRHLIQLQNDDSARTNIGVVNVSETPISVDVRFYEADGAMLEELRIELEPFESRQINDVFSSLETTKALDELHDAFAVASSSTPGAAFFAYATVVDNSTNDAIFVAGR